MVSAILCAKTKHTLVYHTSHRHQMGERHAYNDIAVVRCRQGRVDFLGELDAFLNRCVHLPVTGYNILSHVDKN